MTMLAEQCIAAYGPTPIIYADKDNLISLNLFNWLYHILKKENYVV